MKPLSYPVVLPVIELGFHALELSESEKRLATKIQARAAKHSYMTTPDGWFVPLRDLQDDMPTVAEFLWHETNHYGEFEIGGGFVILVNPRQTIGIPSDSTFRFAVDLANAVINIAPDEKRNVAVGTQDFWSIYADSSLEDIVIESNRPKGFTVKLPVKLLQEQFQTAQLSLINFATELQKNFKHYENWKITSDQFRFWFGLDKLV